MLWSPLSSGEGSTRSPRSIRPASPVPWTPCISCRPLGKPRSGLIQHRQSLGEVSNQIVLVLQPDTETDQAVCDTDAGPHVLRHAGMRGGGGMAHERFRAAQADRQLEDAQPIQHTERLGLTTRDLDAEGRARTRALSGVDPTRGLAAAFTAEGMHRCNLRVKFHRADNGLGVA